ncbi:MAG: hypothetical protein LBH43_19795 [Treponema sp.]|jgi:hypothetical protein|nr:hypothetical protein [Treponema sp.]
MQEKKALAREASKRYQKAGEKEKAGILDEPVKTAGYNRKHILHALANLGEPVQPASAGKPSGLRHRPANGGKGAAGSRNTQAALPPSCARFGRFSRTGAGRYRPPSCGGRRGFWKGRFT